MGMPVPLLPGNIEGRSQASRCCPTAAVITDLVAELCGQTSHQVDVQVAAGANLVRRGVVVAGTELDGGSELDVGIELDGGSRATTLADGCAFVVGAIESDDDGIIMESGPYHRILRREFGDG